MLFVVDLLHALVAVHSELVPLAVVAGIEDRIYLILVHSSTLSLSLSLSL